MPLDTFTSVDAAGKPVMAAEEAIVFTADRTRLFLATDAGQGTLYVTNQHVIWLSLDGSVGYRMDYPYILLHAVCRDVSAFPHPCLYAQLDEEMADEAREEITATLRQEQYESPAEDEEEEEEEAAHPSTISELRFVPENPDILDALWNAMSACAALNPDEDLSDGEGDFLFNEDEVDAFTEGGENVSAYSAAGADNEARMRGLQMSMGVSAEDMYQDADEGEEDYEDEEEAEEAVTSSGRRPKASAPDDGAAVAAQLASAEAQVSAATASAPGKKREREDEAAPEAK